MFIKHCWDCLRTLNVIRVVFIDGFLNKKCCCEYLVLNDLNHHLNVIKVVPTVPLTFKGVRLI